MDKYQKLIENIRSVSEQLKALGETRDDWTEEDRTAFQGLEKQYDEMIAQKAEIDEEREKAAVAERLAALSAPAATRRIDVPRSVRVRELATPRFNGSLTAFRGERAVDNAYDCGLWLRARLFRDEHSNTILERRSPEWLPELRQQTEGVNSAGGFTVPQPLSDAIIAVWQEAGVLRSLADVVPMTSDVLSIPKDTAGQTVYYPGEATAITASTVTFDRIQLNAVKRAVLTQLSNELVADSAINIADYVARRMGHAFAYQADNELINGNSTSTYGGETGLIALIGSAGTATQGTGSTWAAIVLSDFNATLGKLPSRFAAGNLAWLMRREFFFAVVQKLMYAAGGNTVSDIAGGTGVQLFGYPVFFSNHMPTDSSTNIAAFFGNWMEAVKLGDRQTVQVATSQDYAFNQDLLSVRGISRYDINCYELGDSSNAGAVVALKQG